MRFDYSIFRNLYKDGYVCDKILLNSHFKIFVISKQQRCKKQILQNQLYQRLYLIKIDLRFFKIAVIDIKEIREYQPLFEEFDEYTRFLFIMTMLRVFYIIINFLVFFIWQ